MIVYKYKKDYDGVITYRWDVVINNDIKIGAFTLVVNLTDHTRNKLIACFDRSENDYPESYIKQLTKDFKYLTNNKLLDVDEDYERFLYVDVEIFYGKDIPTVTIFY